jgi:predicted GIY-YIG superfamily endonuclease
MYYCYIVSNGNDRTYNGYTVNLDRRLRQHNGIIKGGAKATSGRGPWEFVLILTSPCWDCISTAMKHEWSIKYPTRKRPRPKEYNGVMGRLKSFVHIFQHMEKQGCEQIVCYVKEKYVTFMEDISEMYSFVEVRDIETLSVEQDIETHGVETHGVETQDIETQDIAALSDEQDILHTTYNMHTQ